MNALRQRGVDPARRRRTSRSTLSRRIVVTACALPAVLCACGDRPPSGRARKPPLALPAALARKMDRIAELKLPTSSRPGGTATPDAAVLWPFEKLRTIDGMDVYGASLPIRPRQLSFNSRPPGMELRRTDGDALAFSRGGSNRPGTWALDRDSVWIRLPEGASPPARGEYEFVYPRACDRERALNRVESELRPIRFASRSLELDDVTRTGLFLPAPSRAAWDVKATEDAILTFEATVLPPEYRVGLASDGARLTVILECGEKRSEYRTDVRVGEWVPVRVELRAFAGKTTRIRLRTDPGPNTPEADEYLDYVFLADPVVYEPRENPRRAVLVFADTLRRDHMGTYGYARPTTPGLDAWAEGAVVFENARSVAPWTLPSARSMLSGREPELWADGPCLPEPFARAGWVTAAFVGNAYLSSSFDMADGWSFYRCVNWPPASEQVAQAEAFLAQHADRDALLMLHTMDTHLPYSEPAAYRGLWEGQPPAGMEPGASRETINRLVQEDRETTQRYVIGRYDQNLRFLDDELAGFIGRLGPEATVMFVSDHGEEFWEHGQFEHGHTLFEELLEVPLILSHPSLPAARIEAPVSVLDVAPTLADLFGMELAGARGRSLLPLLDPDVAAASDATRTLEERPQAFGRVLYGRERWGVLRRSLKWSVYAGTESMYDLARDPGERVDLIADGVQGDLDELRAALGTALGRPVAVCWEVVGSRLEEDPAEPMSVTISHPAGIAAAWLSADPRGLVNDVELAGPDAEGKVNATFHAATAGRDIYLQPAGDPTDYGGLRFESGDTLDELSASDPLKRPDGQRQVLGRAKLGERAFTVTYTVAPLPGAGREVVGFDPEAAAALEALGYGGGGD